MYKLSKSNDEHVGPWAEQSFTISFLSFCKCVI